MQQETKQRGVLLTEKIKVLVAPVIVVAGLGQTLKLFDPVLGRINIGDEFETTQVDGLQDFGQGRQTVDGLFKGSILGGCGLIPMLNLPALLKEGDIVNRSFNPQENIELVIQLDGHRFHLVLQASAQPTLVELITQLILVIAVQFTS
ncbi:MAG: hypothetical protein AB1801_14090 [Chloroflexota bacterium]